MNEQQAHSKPIEAAQTSARMLTEKEWLWLTDDMIVSKAACEAVQRKFCEVNNIRLASAAPAAATVPDDSRSCRVVTEQHPENKAFWDGVRWAQDGEAATVEVPATFTAEQLARNGFSTPTAQKAEGGEVPVVFADDDEFTTGVNAAASMLEKMADDLADKHCTTDRDTGVREIARAYEDEYNRLRELADDVRSIVHGNPQGKR